MPCRDYDDDHRSRDDSALRQLRERNDQLMRCICKMDSVMTAEQLDRCGSEVKRVVLEHRKQDALQQQREAAAARAKAERERKERERKQAIASLSPQQRKALGL